MTKISTSHPSVDKTGRNIDRVKYDLVKEAIVYALQKGEMTHGELLETVKSTLKGFQGSLPWYFEMVKLDLEAKKIIERTENKPVHYRLS